LKVAAVGANEAGLFGIGVSLTWGIDDSRR
jgi:hypothetical protein